MPEITVRSQFPTAPVQGVNPPPRQAPQLQNTSAETPPGAGQANPPDQKSPDAQRLEALARRESQIRRESQRVAQERQQTEALKTQLLQQQAENQRLRGWAERFYREPIQVLNEAGVHGDVITQGLLNQPSRDHMSIRQLQSQIAQLAEQNKSLETKITDGQTSSYEQAKTQVKADAKSLFATDATSYEACSANGEFAIEAIVELIEQTMEKEERLLSVKEAADLVENELIEEAVKFAGLKKVQTKLGAANTTPPAGQQRQQGAAASAGATTLSHRSIPAPSPNAGGTYKEREKARVQRAIEAFSSASASRAQQ